MKWRAKFYIVSTILGMAVLAQAAGLSTTFVDVTVEGASIGTFTEAHGPEGKGLLVRNLGDAPVQVFVQAIAPTPKQMRPGSEVLPDFSWVHFDPPSILVLAHGEKEIKVSVKIPSRRKYRNKIYQTMVWSRGETAHSQGISLNAGLLSCLRIHTAP